MLYTTHNAKIVGSIFEIDKYEGYTRKVMRVHVGAVCLCTSKHKERNTLFGDYKIHYIKKLMVAIALANQFYDVVFIFNCIVT